MRVGRHVDNITEVTPALFSLVRCPERCQFCSFFRIVSGYSALEQNIYTRRLHTPESFSNHFHGSILLQALTYSNTCTQKGARVHIWYGFGTSFGKRAESERCTTKEGRLQVAVHGLLSSTCTCNRHTEYSYTLKPSEKELSPAFQSLLENFEHMQLLQQALAKHLPSHVPRPRMHFF